MVNCLPTARKCLSSRELLSCPNSSLRHFGWHPSLTPRRFHRVLTITRCASLVNSLLQNARTHSVPSLSSTTRSIVFSVRVGHSMGFHSCRLKSGATEEKPVGTVCFSWYKRNEGGSTACICFDGDRLRIREQACMLAMQGLIDMLQKAAE